MSDEPELDALQDALAKAEAELRAKEQDKQARERISAARIKLLRKSRPVDKFYGPLVMRLDPKPAGDPSVKTACTDGRSILYNTQYILGLPTLDEVIGVMVHEVEHVAKGHHVRLDPRRFPDNRNRQFAADLAINHTIRSDGYHLPQGGVFPGEGEFQDLPPGLCAEEYYRRLPPDDGKGEGDNPDPGGSGGFMPPPPSASPSQEAAKWQGHVAAAAKLADAYAKRTKGALPGHIAEQIDAILHPVVPWQDVLREFIRSTAKNDYSWKRPNRRFLHRGLYLPGMLSDEMGEIVVAIDTSGSISNADLVRFMSELQGILDMGCACTVHVIQCDAKVHCADTWHSEDGPLPAEMRRAHGRGGTDHCPVFERIEQEQDWSPVCIVCLTDLETTFPDHAPDVPVLWVTPEKTDVKPPFGEVLVMEK